MRRLSSATIWAHGAIPPGEWKYRHLKRIWLPVYDVVAALAGWLAYQFGSRLLNDLLTPSLVDFVGWAYAGIAVICFIGVAFPSLWIVEISGKIVLVGLIVGYIATIWLYSHPAPGEPPNWFIMAMLAGLLPMPLFRLELLGEERVVRWLKSARVKRERLG